MKRYFLAFFFVLLIPSFAFASWWNPLTWNWNPLSWFATDQHADITQQHPQMPVDAPTSTTPAETKLSAEPTTVADPQTRNNPIAVPSPNAALCNGTYWSACPSDQSFVCPSSGTAYCLPNQQSRQESYQDTLQTNLQSIIDARNAKYQQIEQQMESELNPIESQIDELNAQYNSQCNFGLELMTGQPAKNCMNLSLKIMDLQNQEKVIVAKYALLIGAPISSLTQPLPASNYWQITSSDGGGTGMISNPFGSQVYQFSCSSPANCSIFGL
jgi:hypothetical protein